MRPYGIKRNEYHDDDCAGIRENGRKTSLGHPVRAAQTSKNKQAARRHLKRRARAEGKKSIKEE